jgi:hypothetical protein
VSARVLAVLLLALGACGGASGATDAGEPGFPDTPLATVTSDSGQLTVAVRTDPQPPSRGVVAVRLTVTGADGAPMDGLALSVQPWMPEMAHGSSTTPSVTARGGGVYDLDDVYLAMPGTWQLRLTFDGPTPDHATPELQIP